MNPPVTTEQLVESAIACSDVRIGRGGRADHREGLRTFTVLVIPVRGETEGRGRLHFRHNGIVVSRDRFTRRLLQAQAELGEPR